MAMSRVWVGYYNIHLHTRSLTKSPYPSHARVGNKLCTRTHTMGSVGVAEKVVGVGGGDIGECQALLLNVSLQAHSSDRWLWQWGLDDGYTVRGAYQLLTAHDVIPLGHAAGLIWHSRIPLKVSILVWRLLRDRLPIKANLSTRGIIPAADHYCVSDCGAAETAQHLFLSCSTFGCLWVQVGEKEKARRREEKEGKEGTQSQSLGKSLQSK
ncbi:hypothetical protein TSUD_294880 [Trifolium subterraneum]|uniref:Reverse transcriptase zinc-binding domain-containing protein n=1 Tax=Trifolium subterraneum TaxID=3900 RepID=A0A2Z6MXM3_TRISU|nr:hypothetical protein TSUD_294880 [Trifolium subterraneum]